MTSIEDIFHKIRQICEACYQSSDQQLKIPRNYKNVSISSSSSSPTKQIPQVIIKQYLTALQYLQYFTQQLSEFKQQYQSLQQSLQKQQLEIRKHIGIQQQLRLYSESIKAQLQQSQKERLELLDNSKLTIKNLKMKNQMLFQELAQLKKKKNNLNNNITNAEYEKVTKTYQHTSVKSKVKEKSLSVSGQRKDSSLNKIIKTQYIERQKIPFLNMNIRKQLKYKGDTDFADKKHKHHKSTFIHQEPQTSQSKKKHRLQLLQKGKKQKNRYSNSKGFDLGMYISKHQLKKSPFKNIDKSSNKQQLSSKKTDKQHKKSFHERSSKPQTDSKHKKDEIKDNKGHQNKQKSRSKESKKNIKSKEHLKHKLKQSKKAPNHNRSLFSVSSVQYRTNPRNATEK